MMNVEKFDSVKDIMLLNAHPDWAVKKLGQLFEERRQKVSDTEFPPLSVTKNGIVPQLDSAAKTDDGDNRKLVLAGDYVINSRSDRKGSGGLSELDGSVSLINIVLQPREIYPRFIHHLLRSQAFQEEFYRWGHGIVADLWTTRFYDMKNIRLAVPDVKTQKQIADFLDRETARIDLLIKKKTTFINLLEEKQILTVTEAVKGDGLEAPQRLRPWISINPSKKEINLPLNAQVTFAPMEAISDRFGGLDVSRTVSLSDVEASSYNYFAEGDLLIAKVTPCFENGKKAIAKGLCNGVGFSTSEVFVIRPNTGRLDRNYLRYLFSSEDFRAAGMASMTGAGGLRRVSEAAIRNFKLPVVSLDNQKNIANYLDRILEKQSNLMQATQFSISRLQELRSSLITAAVTGSLDIHTWGRRGNTERHLDNREQSQQQRVAS